MDTGSQRSYIRGEQLALTDAGRQCLTITTFGAMQRSKRVCEYVRVGIKLKMGEV